MPRLLLLVTLALAACAHAPPVAAAPPPPAPAPEPPPRPQLQATVVAPVDPAAELAAALAATPVFFAFDSDRLGDEGMAALRRVAEVLRRHPSLAIKVEGNCDDRGTEEYNLMLGQRRAEVARRYLTDLGVASAQVETISYGELRPAVPGENELSWSKNRRDELHASSR